MNILKQSIAATIKLGAFVDDTDGKTAKTGLTISQADIRLSKNGGDFAQTNNATGATHDEFGYYDIPLDTTDTGTLGRLRVAVSVSGALPVWQDFLVVTANVYDTLCSTDSLDVNVTALANDVITSNAFDESSAYPLKSADTGTTQVARVGADSDTLETLSDEIAAVKAETAAILVDTGTTLDGNITAIKAKTDQLVFANNRVNANADLTGIALEASVQSVKAKTDNLPASPAATGDAMTLADGAVTAAKIGNSAIAAAKIATDAVTKIQTGLAKTTDLNGLATEANATANKNEIKTAIADKPVTPATNIDNLPTKTDIETAKDAIISAMPELDLSTIPDDLLSKIIVGELTVEQVLKVLAAIELGTTIGGGTSTITYTGRDGTKVTLSGVDESGNRGVVNVEFED